MTSNGITAEEPRQNPVIVFSITFTQQIVRPPVWIIRVLHAELASVRALLVKSLDHSNLPSTLELVCAMYLPCCTHTHKQNSENANTNSHEHISTSRAQSHARTHTHTHTHLHRNTCTRHLQSLEVNVLRHILQHHSWVCLIIPDSIERSHLIFFTYNTYNMGNPTTVTSFTSRAARKTAFKNSVP